MSRATMEGLNNATVSVGGVRLHYFIGGDPAGPPVLLWHGFLSTAYAWRAVATALAEAGCSVLAPDMRGYGDSDKPGGTDGYDACALAEEFRALVREIGFGGGRPLTLAAHDMGAPPALLWAADHPSELTGLLYIEAPVMLGDVLRKVIEYSPEAMKHGSMWWWILPLAPDVPERLVVGHERAFLTWFYEGAHTAKPEVFTREVVDEYLRSFSGRAGVLGSMGVYRTAFASIAQTEPLRQHRVNVPVVAIGGAKGLGAMVAQMVGEVASDVEAVLLADCGHFVPEECPEAVVERVLAMVANSRD